MLMVPHMLSKSKQVHTINSVLHHVFQTNRLLITQNFCLVNMIVISYFAASYLVELITRQLVLWNMNITTEKIPQTISMLVLAI